MLDGGVLYSIPLDYFIQRYTVFVALRVCYAALCCLARLWLRKDGSRPYSPLYGRFLRPPFQQPHWEMLDVPYCQWSIIETKVHNTF